jgi:hypothetical protein
MPPWVDEVVQRRRTPPRANPPAAQRFMSPPRPHANSKSAPFLTAYLANSGPDGQVVVVVHALDGSVVAAQVGDSRRHSRPPPGHGHRVVALQDGESHRVADAAPHAERGLHAVCANIWRPPDAAIRSCPHGCASGTSPPRLKAELHDGKMCSWMGSQQVVNTRPLSSQVQLHREAPSRRGSKSLTYTLAGQQRRLPGSRQPQVHGLPSRRDGIRRIGPATCTAQFPWTGAPASSRCPARLRVPLEHDLKSTEFWASTMTPIQAFRDGSSPG